MCYLPHIQLSLAVQDFRDYALAANFREVCLADVVFQHEVLEHIGGGRIRQLMMRLVILANEVAQGIREWREAMPFVSRASIEQSI
ncbi:hypothetical protein WK67_13305 [Burkholderia ubonensis]|uniref:Uncharacterized protein n=1 Tax=Burkholderia ubonensis TaxID=101571 RepID=A0AAU8UEL8_9BURK|nr:hypothetical protein WK67_13305 [Burkholderia ubonensis]